MTATRMTAPSWRYLTAAENALAHEVFGAGIAPARVRILCQPFVTRPFTPSSAAIVWPPGEALEDFTEGTLREQADFVHEMTHVWQAQHGVLLALAKLKAGDSDASYKYDLIADLTFPQMNIEQQARFVEHAFLASRGGQTPHPATYYEGALAHYHQA